MFFRFVFVLHLYSTVPAPRLNSYLIDHCKGLGGFDDVIFVVFILSPNTFCINDTLNIFKKLDSQGNHSRLSQ